jgi:hypothetical protein
MGIVAAYFTLRVLLSRWFWPVAVIVAFIIAVKT